MTRDKNKVIVWRPFPSPTKKKTGVINGMLNPLRVGTEESQRQEDQAAVNRGIELADILNGTGKPKLKKRRAVA